MSWADQVRKKESKRKLVESILNDPMVKKAQEEEIEPVPVTAEGVLEWLNIQPQGRLVELPCEIGDTVYAIAECEHINKVLDGTMYGVAQC